MRARVQGLKGARRLRRYASCAVPPQFTDDEIDRQLETADGSRHLAHCRRPPLGQCTEAEFEEDLYGFLAERGEGELANDLRNKRINWCAAAAGAAAWLLADAPPWCGRSGLHDARDEHRAATARAL